MRKLGAMWGGGRESGEGGDKGWGDSGGDGCGDEDAGEE